MTPAGSGHRKFRAYWDARIDDTKLSDHPRGSLGFYQALDAYHLEKCDYLLRRLDFGAWSGRDVLEIGCGSGLDLVRFARAGARATGVDISTTALDLAAGYCRVAGVEANLVEADGASLPFGPASFDLVYCMGVLPFAADPAGIVAEAHRVLRPGGQGIFMVYHRRSWMNALSMLTGRREGHTDAPGFHLYTRQEFDRLLDPFPERRIMAERFPAPSPRRQGVAGFAVNRALIPVLRGLPDIFWRPYGWHLLAFCRKAA
jgi:SAM-dependent methyltransferase